MDAIATIITIIVSSGIVGFGMKIYIEKSLKSYFDENFERKKAEIEIKKNLRQKTEDAKLSIAAQSIELLSKGRRTCRYMLSLLGNYLSPIEFKPYEKYLSTSDKSLEIKDIYKKIAQESNILRSINDELITQTDRSHAYNSRFTHRYLHDTHHLYNSFIDLIFEIKYSPSQSDFNKNIILIGQLLDIYMEIDQNYELTNKAVENYLN